MESKLVIRCARCGQGNRVPVARLRDAPKCGQCKQALPPPADPFETTDAELPGLLEQSPLPIVVDFWAPWCGPCRMIGPVLEDLAKHLAGRILVAKLNVDENPQMASAYEVRSIPLLIGFAKGRPVATQVGALPPPALSKWVEKVAAAA